MYVILVSAEKTLSARQAVLNLGKAAYWCVFASSALNPYIYGFRNPQFRKEFQFILGWLCPCVRRGLRMRGCSSTTGSRGSWDGSGFDYNQMRRPSTPCVTPKGRLSVDFAPLPPNSLQKLEMLALQAKLSNYSCDPGSDRSHEENEALGAQTGTGDENFNNNNNNSFYGTEPAGSQGNFIESLAYETNLHSSTPNQESLTKERSVRGSNFNEGFVCEDNAESSIIAPTNERENESEISSSLTQADSPDGLSVVLLAPTRPRGWSLRALGARLKLGWVESSL